MSKDATIGLVVPFAEDKVPDEGRQMYPDARFLPRGVGVRSLTPEGFAAAFDAIVPAADHLAAQGVDAIMVIGTSLTFYRGPEVHDRLLERLRARTGLRVSSMSAAIIDGLRAVGAKRVAVATAYSDVVNQRLNELLEAAGFEVLALECFNILDFGGPSSKSEDDIIALSEKSVAAARDAEGIADLLRRSAYARRRQAARSALRDSGGRQHAGGVLGGHASRRRERADRGLWPAA